MSSSQSVEEEFGLIVPMLVIPIAATTAVKLAHFSWKHNQIIEILPLFLVQVCSVFVWSCQFSFYFYEKHTDSNTTDLWRLTTELLLALAIYIDPINSFIYTWRFLLSLEEGYSGLSKRVNKGFRVTSIWLVPFVSIGLYLCLSLVEARMLQQGELLIQKSPDANYQLYI